MSNSKRDLRVFKKYFRYIKMHSKWVESWYTCKFALNCIVVYFQQIKGWEVARNSRSSSHGDFNLASTEGRSESGQGGLCRVQCRQSGRARRRVREERGGRGQWLALERERHSVNIIYYASPHTGQGCTRATRRTQLVALCWPHLSPTTQCRQNWPGRINDDICQTLPFVNGFTDFLVANWSAATGPVWAIQTTVCLSRPAQLAAQPLDKRRCIIPNGKIANNKIMSRPRVGRKGPNKLKCQFYLPTGEL